MPQLLGCSMLATRNAISTTSVVKKVNHFKFKLMEKSFYSPTNAKVASGLTLLLGALIIFVKPTDGVQITLFILFGVLTIYNLLGVIKRYEKLERPHIFLLSALMVSLIIFLIQYY